jgi:hypothetical protein
MKAFCSFLLFVFLIYSCKLKDEPNFPDIRIPERPVNMGDINSEYDDFNSDIPWAGIASPLVFSSNRSSKGQNFDFVYKLLDVY